MCSKHDCVCSTCRLHTKEHTHSCDGTTNCGTVFHKCAKGFDEVYLFAALFVKLCILVAANGDVLKHKEEARKTENAHNKSRPEHLVTVKDFKLSTG